MLCVRHSVSGWTCQPQPVCLFHREDRILAINDLLTTSLQEFNMYLSKCLKNEVRSRKGTGWADGRVTTRLTGATFLVSGETDDLASSREPAAAFPGLPLQ